MSFATYSGEKDRKEFNTRCMTNARKGLQKYPLISKLVKNFNNFETVSEIENPFFWSCVKSQDTNSMFSNPEYYRNTLSRIEEILKIVGIDKEKTKRATSLNEANSYSLYLEILLFDELSKKIGLKNIECNPLINGKRPEYKIKFLNKEFCIEQTSLISGDTENKLKKLFRDVAEEIYLNLKPNTRLSIRINSFNLSWDEKTGLNLDASRKIVLDSIKKLDLYPFFNTHTPIEHLEWDLRSLANVGTEKLEDSKEVLKYFEGMGKYLVENLDKEPSKSFLKNSVKDIKSSPILRFFSIHGKYTLIDLQTELIFPSQLAETEKKAWLNALYRKIDYKIKEDQFSDTMPNLLFIKADTWCLRDYYKNGDPDQEIVIGFLVSLLESIKNDKISAVVLYNGEISKSLIVINPYANNKISEDEIKAFI